MIELITGMLRAVGEITVWFFGGVVKIFKGLITDFRDIVFPPSKKYPPQEVFISRQIKQSAPVSRRNYLVMREAALVKREGPPPSHKIDPKQFFRWASQDIKRWELLNDADVIHSTYGKGTIYSVYRKNQESNIIYFSILFEKDESLQKILVSDFNMNPSPFVELLVDSACIEELRKNLYSPPLR